jgi:serine/threonine protein kinase
VSDSSSILGRTVSHYRVLEKLGAGGMGEVYRAHDERLDRDVAIKILPPSARDNQDARNRLLEEARSASQLNHSHICTVYEVGEENGVAFIAMEFIAGRTLSAIIPPDAPTPRHMTCISRAAIHSIRATRTN